MSTPTLHVAPASAMASVQQSPMCAWGCAYPMQPVPDAPDTWRCAACGCIAMRDAVAPGTAAPTRPTQPAHRLSDEAADAIFAIVSTLEILDARTREPVSWGSTMVVSYGDAIIIATRLRMALGLLRSSVLDIDAEAVHATAIEAAARVCENRSHSLYHESHQLVASLEAQKCARAVRAIRTAGALARRPSLTATRSAGQ